MKIVIDIPEEVRVAITRMGLFRIPEEMVKEVDKAIQNGTPLPKGHGRLIDADAIRSKLMLYRDRWDVKCVVPTNDNLYELGRYESYDFAVDEVDSAPTIIEADK